MLWWAHLWKWGIWGCCTSPWRGKLRFHTALENPPPEFALCSDFPFYFAGFAFAVAEKQKLKTLLLWWQMGFGGHLFLQGKNVCPTYDFICVETFHYSVAGAEMLICLCQTSLIKLSTESAKNEAIYLSQLLNENCSVT